MLHGLCYANAKGRLGELIIDEDLDKTEIQLTIFTANRLKRLGL